jgi:hypothetical protein
MTLIVVPEVLKFQPLLKSRKKLEQITDELRIRNLTPDKLQDEFARYLASVLRARVQRSIQLQTIGTKHMKDIYKPLSPDYNKTKPKFSKDKFWINTRYLVDHIQIFKTGREYRVGFKNSDTYIDGKTKVAKVVVWLERGTKNIPARPLFSVHSKYITKNIMRFFAHFLKFRFGVIL